STPSTTSSPASSPPRRRARRPPRRGASAPPSLAPCPRPATASPPPPPRPPDARGPYEGRIRGASRPMLTPSAPDTPRVALRGIEKSFPGVRALRGVDLEVGAGEVHALCGENGAGKSTLIRVLGGVVRPDAGQVVLDGRAVRFRDPADALAQGVAVIHQEFSL